MRDDFPSLGCGVGLRRSHYAEILQVLDGVRTNYPIVMHGVSLSIGSADVLNQNYLRDLAALARQFEPAWISDHLCWTGVCGRNLHDLLPLPYTEEAVKHCAQRIRQVQELLGRRILIENISSYMQYRSSRMSEVEFVAAVAEEADCGILLDINNVYVNAFNHRFNSEDYLDALPVGRIAQFHLGHRDCRTHLLDSHDHTVSEAVWKLYEHAVQRFGAVATLIEWDDQIPSFPELAAAVYAREIACSVLEHKSLASGAYTKHRRDDLLPGLPVK
jgi:uncharacterized protein